MEEMNLPGNKEAVPDHDLEYRKDTDVAFVACPKCETNNSFTIKKGVVNFSWVCIECKEQINSYNNEDSGELLDDEFEWRKQLNELRKGIKND